jgi:hypothetical protein
VFIEQGREGVNKSLSRTSDYLNSIIGENTGLDNTRTHTQPVRKEVIDRGAFPVGFEMPGYINREMYSIPQMANQQDKVPRIVDGKITYFKTSIDATPKEDADYRTAVASVDVVPQELINQAAHNLRATQVRTIQKAQSAPANNPNAIEGDINRLV